MLIFSVSFQFQRMIPEGNLSNLFTLIDLRVPSAQSLFLPRTKNSRRPSFQMAASRCPFTGELLILRLTGRFQNFGVGSFVRFDRY